MTLGEWMIPVMNVALVTGVAVVLPLGFARPFFAWWVSALGVVVSLALPAGPLAALALVPWLVTVSVLGVQSLRARAWWVAMAAGFAGTACLALVTSRLEVTLFDIHEPIVKLTALHFTYAGAGTLLLAHRLAESRPSTWSRVTRWLVFIAPPVVASGFVTRVAAAQVGGAVLMTAGAWLVAAQQVRDARASGSAWWWSSALSPWVAMVLGVLWAAAQYWPSIPALTVVDMVPTHGALNAFGFVLCGHVAWAKERAAKRP